MDTDEKLLSRAGCGSSTQVAEFASAQKIIDKMFGGVEKISTFAPTVLATLPVRTAYQGETSSFMEGRDYGIQ